MTFATEIIKRRTTRATLVRLNPARYISIELGSEGAGIYSMANTRIISGIKRNGVALTADTTDPTVNDHYYYNATTGEITVKLASTPNGTSNVVIAYYYLFYTSGNTPTYYNETPTDTATTKRYWQPRLKSDAQFRESLDGLEAGIISVSDSTIEIDNTDFAFEANLGTKDSLNNKSCMIWQEINDVISLVYSGFAYAVSVTPTTVAISISDQLNLLSKTAYMGDTAAECIHFTGIKISDLGKSIPLHLAEFSWRDIKYSLDYTGLDYDGARKASALVAICTSHNDTLGTSNNRTWTLCRSPDGLDTQSFGSIVAVTPVAGGHVSIEFSTLSNVNIGDTFKWTETAVVGYGIITGKSGYSIAVQWKTGIGYVEPTTSSTVTALKSHGIILEDNATGIQHFPSNIRDYTVAETATSGGNKTIVATFVNNFEANMLTAIPPLSSGAFTVYYYVQNTGSFIHGTILKSLLDASGVTTNAASFTAADSALTDETCFSIPAINESEYSSYSTYAQKILASTLGYIRNNASAEIEYNLIETPASLPTRSEDETLEPGVSYEIEYRDIVTQLVPHNAHIPLLGRVSADNSSESTKSQYLHDTNRSEKFQHVLAGDSSGNIGRQAEILARKSNRRIGYKYRTETMDLSSMVGDGHSLEWSSFTPVDLFITGVDKSENETVITGIDLFDV